MPDPLIVSISDLRSAVQRALDVTEARLGADVTLHVDYYWHVPVDEAFDMTQEPHTFTSGQVTDDLESVLDNRERIPEEAWHDLSHLIGVLRALELAARS